MTKLAREVMTPDPARCSVTATLDEVAKLMVQHDCGEIPIVCRAVAAGKNPTGQFVESVMTHRVVTVRADAPLEDVVTTMERHQIRRVPVVDESGCWVGSSRKRISLRRRDLARQRSFSASYRVTYRRPERERQHRFLQTLA